MNVRSRLRRWQEAGVIDSTTAEHIANFEKQQPGPSAMKVFASLGGATTGLGVISLVAANWGDIPGGVKIGVDVGLLFVLSAVVLWARARNKTFVLEAAVATYYVCVLASLGLIDQVYQLDAPAYQLLLVWSCATVPLVLLARGRFLPVVWAASLVLTYGMCIEPIADAIDHINSPISLEAASVVMSLFAVPPLFRAVARIPGFAARRPYHAGAIATAANLMVYAAVVVSTFVWYGEFSESDRSEAAIAVLASGVIVVLTASVARWLWPKYPSRWTVLPAGLMIFAWLQLATGATFARDAWPVVGALCQLALLGLCAAMAHWRSAYRAFNLLTGLIGLRILIVYFEVFGSLLDTGIGLVSGGLLTLLLAASWQRFRNHA